MIDALDHETLVKVDKQGFFSRSIQLRDLIASVQSNSDGPPQARGEAHTVSPFCVWLLPRNAHRQRAHLLQGKTNMSKQIRGIWKHLLRLFYCHKEPCRYLCLHTNI